MMTRFSLFLFLLAFIPVSIYAAEEQAAETETPVYAQPTLPNLSKLYWAMSLPDSGNNIFIDNYLIINECQIYRDYYQNEFEWANIRDATRKEIKRKIKSFPTRFQFVQPLKLGRYDLESESFEILPKYKIPPTTRFEFFASDLDTIICQQEDNGSPVELKGYPRSLIAELNRPFLLDKVKVAPTMAEQYIKIKMIPYNQLKPEDQTPEKLYDFRDAYIVMQIHFVAPKTMEYLKAKNKEAAQLLGVLEEVKIYADPEQTQLLYEETFKQ